MSAQPANHEHDPDAAPDPGGTVEPGPDTRRHLHPVHDTDAGAEDAPADHHEPDEAAKDDEPGLAHRAAIWAADTFTPHSGLYADRQPSIEETVRRASHGGQLPDAGPLRTAAQAHGYLAAANTALCDTWKWVVNHPARLAVFSVLIALAVAFPPTREALSILLTPFVWARAALA